ncbi:hypothetical protein EV363DRAFT_1421634, partial [Boletus edulis]
MNGAMGGIANRTSARDRRGLKDVKCTLVPNNGRVNTSTHTHILFQIKQRFWLFDGVVMMPWDVRLRHANGKYNQAVKVASSRVRLYQRPSPSSTETTSRRHDIGRVGDESRTRSGGVRTFNRTRHRQLRMMSTDRYRLANWTKVRCMHCMLRSCLHFIPHRSTCCYCVLSLPLPESSLPTLHDYARSLYRLQFFGDTVSSKSTCLATHAT